jgi:hypothetical protein
MRGLVLNVWVGEPPMNDDCGRPRGLEGMGMLIVSGAKKGK